MAFECHEDIDICFSKNLVGSAHNPLKEPSVCSKFKGEDCRDQDRDIVSGNRTREVDASEPGFGSCLNRGATVSLGVKVEPANEVVTPGLCLSITDLPSALISEILRFLDPKELGIVSCVSASLYKLASDHYVWKEFYCERWGLPMPRPVTANLSDEKTWKELFIEREFRSRAYLGQYRRDFLSGHTEAVRTVHVLASENLIFTSGYDCVVRMWDLEEGSAVSSSRPLGCTVRAVAADRRLLVAGGTGGFINYWNAIEGHPHLFDLKGSCNQNTGFKLWAHEGPITCLALDVKKMYSGSWDMTVRVWDRALMKCVMVLRHSDWVWSLAPSENTLASTSGSDVYIWDTTDESLISIIPHAHTGSTYALARSHAGDFLFTGGGDGSINMFEISNSIEDVVIKVATWAPHTGPVHSLAFEFPWLVSASADGKVSLIDVRKLLKNSRQSMMKYNSRKNRATPVPVEPPQRMLHGSGGSLFSVGIGADRLICGGEECTVKVWDFSQALEKERRSWAQKAVRLENRVRRRKLVLEMGSRTDKCSVVAKKDAINNGERNRVWRVKRGGSEKVKA